MKKVFVMMVVVILSMVIFGGKIEEIQKRGVLLIGQDPAYAPFYGVNTKGERIGYEVELAKMMADVLGVKVKFVITNWDGIIPALLADKFDFILAGMTITPERALKVNFTTSYYETGQIIFYNSDKYPNGLTENDLKKMGNKAKIAVQLGTTGEFAARKFFPEAKILTFETVDAAAYQIITKKADAMVFDELYYGSISKKYPAIKTTENLLNKEKLGIAVKKENIDLLLWLNTFIECVKTDGTLDQLKQKWMIEYDWGE
ncbi:periplasmic component of amino acid ABC-type transporter/signal transduction system [Marinitoga piezophila KA3]|uniref:Periplasmic component of amino acid ABC-type transporter/signal transduction system n=1 Tax=Marinitoga piezophila (strain DSM 14283 / JCM 11233 / KA3) TaxID=443254 RepID=H2J6T4_MARPK|nr:transporter substrate-binding domain-containing protein [Marinitoga piezophila]AEX86365.1 periplasmic component of amino acid ABC-type transporter/signal transduction system [Marinitoga piezophila KA3]